MRAFSKVLLPVALAVIAYFVSYFLMVDRGVANVINGVCDAPAEYRFDSMTKSFVASTFFRLAHKLDRHVLRPSMWEWKYTPVAIISGESAVRDEPPKVE